MTQYGQYRHEQLGRFVPYLPSLSESQTEVGLEAHMFIEDISHPMPFSFKRKGEFLACFTGDHGEQAKAIALLRRIAGERAQSAEDALSDAVNSIAKRMAFEGRAQYELLQQNDGSTDPRAISTRRTFRGFGFVVQYLNSTDRKYWKSAALRWARASDLWHVDIPTQLGGRRGHRRILAGLARTSRLKPSFLGQPISDMGLASGFVWKDYTQLQATHTSQLTREWGWNRRDSSTRHTTEFYLVFRSATSERAASIVRSHIISSINKLLQRVGITCSISVSGVLSTDEVESMMARLLKGEMTFKEFLDAKYK